MIITAIDTSDKAGKIARWIPSRVRMDNFIELENKRPEDLINEVLKMSQGTAIARLNVIDHGNREVVQIGKTQISALNFQAFKPSFTLLRGKFTQGGFIHFFNCEVGWAFSLLEQIASATGVTVYGGRGVTQALWLRNPEGLHGVFPNGGGLCTPDM